MWPEVCCDQESAMDIDENKNQIDRIYLIELKFGQGQIN